MLLAETVPSTLKPATIRYTNYELCLLYTAIIPSTQDNTAVIAGVVAAVVLFLLLLGTSIVATGFSVAEYRKRRSVPIPSNPNPTYEVVQDSLKGQAVPIQFEPNPAYKAVQDDSKRQAQSNTDPAYEEVIAAHYIMTPSTAYGVIKSPHMP